MSETYPHRMRLHGPWRAVPVGLGPVGVVTLPGLLATQGYGVVAGPIRLQRVFHWKAVMEDDEEVELTIDGLVGAASVTVNG
ncbi:MAG: hypothetical protein ACRDD1_10355, partial [Planctomycetia bacterium]